jgi:4-hydroxy-3-polyprenylbenzoate decarboxylase
MTTPKRLIVGISGATGVVYAVRLLEVLRDLGIETHLVMTKTGEMTAAYECAVPVKAIKALASVVHPIGDFGASISSGSFRTMGMIVAPCSMRSVAEIAHGTTSNLLTRAADVCLKERRRLVLLAREAPLHAGHLRSMLAVTEHGGIVMPPVPAFYTRPATLDDVVDHTVGRVLDLYDLDAGLVERWTGEDRAKSSNGAGIPLFTPHAHEGA